MFNFVFFLLLTSITQVKAHLLNNNAPSKEQIRQEIKREVVQSLQPFIQAMTQDPRQAANNIQAPRNQRAFFQISPAQLQQVLRERGLKAAPINYSQSTNSFNKFVSPNFKRSFPANNYPASLYNYNLNNLYWQGKY